MTVRAEARDPHIERGLSSCKDMTSHEEIGNLLQGYEATDPEIARFLVIGSSVEGREIWALRISSDPDTESNEPEIRIVGAIHGNECLTADVVLELIDWIISGYGDDQLVNDLVDSTEMLFVPLVNPDGYTGDTATRENANGVDLNRNLGFGWMRAGAHTFSEPETTAIRDISQASSITLGLTYHTVASYVNGPWNYKPHHPLDEDLVSTIGHAYAGSSSYNVVFGWDWYATNGDLNDWALGTQGTFDWTIELMSDTDMQWSIHGPGTQNFLSYVFYGVRGVVTDAASQEPLPARIEIDPLGEPVFTDPDVGDYHRILLPGTYDITAIANGYETTTAQGVVVPDDGVVDVDFELERADVFTAFAINEMEMPQTITHEDFRANRYENETLTSDVLGPPDGRFYSMSPGGKITCDMGASTRVGDEEGIDLIVRSGTASDDEVTVLVAAGQDDEFVEVANDSGDIEVDIAGSGLDEIRYVKLVDDGDGQFNSEYPGYDLDAIENLSPVIDEDTDEDDTDSESDTADDDDDDDDNDDDEDTDSETDIPDDDDDPFDDDDDDNDANEIVWVHVGYNGCGCVSTGLSPDTPDSLLDLYLF